MVALRAATPAIAELKLAPLGRPLDYRPGQYVLLEDAQGEVVVRSFSVACAPRADDHITLLVTRVAGGQLSEWVHDRLATGDDVLISGPYGTFTDDAPPSRPALYLAAGSGLAPVRALLEADLARPQRPALTLVFSARTEADVIDAPWFARWQRRDPRFRFVRTLTRGAGPPPHGRVPELLPKLAGPLAGHDVFIAGSSGFVAGCVAAAAALGAPRAQIHTEVFYAEPVPWTGAPPSASTPP